MKLPILQALLFGIPENIAYALFCWTLLNPKIVLNKVLTIGVIQTAVIFLVRSLPLPFGMHTVIGIVTLTFLMKHYSKENFTKIFVVVLSIFFIVGAGEFINFTILGAIWGKEVVFEEPNFALLFGFFQLIYLCVVVYLTMMIKKRKQKAFSVPEQL